MDYTMQSVLKCFRKKTNDIAVFIRDYRDALEFCRILEENGIRDINGKTYYDKRLFQWILQRAAANGDANVTFASNGRIYTLLFTDKSEYKFFIDYKDIEKNSSYVVNLI